MANTVADQPNLRADDPMVGMTHSEVHYFNRYVGLRLHMNNIDIGADCEVVTITMVCPRAMRNVW